MKLWYERGAWASARGRRLITAMKPADVRRIAVVRHAALGDMVLVRPFLAEARRFFPNAEIVLSLVSNYMYGAPTDLVDAVHVLHGNQEKGVSFAARVRRARELGPVDILFDLADTTRSRYLCLLSKARVKIGFPYRWYLRDMLFDAAVPRSDFSFEAVNMLDALMLLGANPRFPLDFAWPDNLPSAAINPRKSIVYFPFASAPSKCWPPELFKELILNLSRLRPDFSHVVLAGIQQEERLDSWSDDFLDCENVLLQPPLSLENLRILIQRATLVVSNDTGVRNLAIALNCPTIGIFFSTVPYRYWPRDGRHETIFETDGAVPQQGKVCEAVLRLTYLS